MSSYRYGGSLELKSEIEEYEADPVLYGGYPFGIPKVYLNGEGEWYTKLEQFNWEDDSVVLIRNHCVLEYMSSRHCEFLYEDQDGEHIWVDGRRVSKEEDLNMEYLGEVRGANHYTVTEYDVEKGQKRKYSCLFEEEMTMTREDYYRLSHIVNEGALDSHFEIKDGVLSRYFGNDIDLYIPDGVTEIAGDAFEGGGKFNCVIIPSTVTKIPCGFCNTEQLEIDKDNPKYYIQDGCLIDKEEKELVWAHSGCTIPDDGSVVKIGSNSFAWRRDLTSIVVPDAVTEIGSGAFSHCFRLKEITLPVTFVDDAERIFGTTLVKDGDKWTLESSIFEGFSF